MDENMSDDEKNNDNTSSDKTKEKVKRLKFDNEQSSSVSNSGEKGSASTSTTDSALGASSSTDSSFPKLKSKNRNYRRNKTDESSRGSGEEEVEQDVAGDATQVIADDDETHSMPDHFGGNGSDISLGSSPPLPDSESESEMEECAVLSKQKPKHTWFVVPELINRQIGYNSKLQSRELFQRRCYGSLRSVQRLELMYKLEEHEGCVNSLNFHHDGSLLASGADDLKIVVWDWKLGKSLLKYKTKHRGNVFQSKFLHLSGDLHIASCARDGQVRIAQVSREEGVRDNRLLGSHKGPCHKLIVLVEQPHIILSAGEDGSVISHDVRCPKSHKIVNVKEDGREVALYSIHGHPLKTHEFCVSGRDEVVRIYDQRNTSSPAATHSPFKKVTSHDYMGFHVTCAVYNHDGSEILASYSDADIYLFDVNAPMGSFIHKYQGHRNGATIKGVNFFGPKSEFIISGSDCGHIYFWEKNTEAIVQWVLADDNGVVNCLEPHPQLPFLCTSGLDWDVKVWVPSCENEPTWPDLAETIKTNLKLRINWSVNNDGNESQMLWMLWRHLRSTNRMRRAMTLNADDFLFHVNTTSSSSTSTNSDSVSHDDNDEEDDDLDGPTNCSTS